MPSRELLAVGFDLDGTLLDFRATAESALRAWLADRAWGRDQDDMGDEWSRLAAIHFERYVSGHISFEQQGRDRVAGLLEWLDLDPTQFDLDDLFADYRERFESSCVAFSDARAALDTVRSMGLRVGALSNGFTPQKEANLRASGLRDRFDVVLASSELPAPKPDPRAFHSLCVGLHAVPSQVLFVGDHLGTDVYGAIGAGMPAAWINRDGAAGPDGVPTIGSLDELAGLLRQWTATG